MRPATTVKEGRLDYEAAPPLAGYGRSEEVGHVLQA
jgi:hypothetical protein